MAEGSNELLAKAATSPLITLYEKNVLLEGIRISAPFNDTPSVTRLELRNQSNKWAAFRLKCTHPKYFNVKPKSTGLIAARGCQEIRLILLPSYNPAVLSHMLIETTFLTTSRKIPDSSTKEKVVEIWNETPKADIASTRFPIQISHSLEDEDPPTLLVYFDEPQSLAGWISQDDDYWLRGKTFLLFLYKNETFRQNAAIFVLLLCQLIFIYFSVTMVLSS